MRKNFWSLFIIMGAFLAAPVQAKLYKWTDDKGAVHYGDSIPARYLNKEHDEMNAQGQTVKQVDPEKAEAERKEAARQAEIKKEKDKKLAAQRQRDRVLLDTYTTERDLIAARDARFEAVDSQIQLSESIIDDSKAKLESSQKLADSLKKQGKPIPETLAAKIEREQSQIATQEDVKQSRVKQRKDIADQFNGYIARFRVLKQQQEQMRKELEQQNQ